MAAFKGLLLAKGAASAPKWNDVDKLFESDTQWRSRWDSCSDVVSIGERKQALAEYQTKRANEIRKEERLAQNRSMEAFGQMSPGRMITVSTTLLLAECAVPYPDNER
jgi:pre-mRNA-processing factor 40